MDASARPTWRSRAWIVALSVLAAIWLVLAAFGIDGPQAGMLVGLVGTAAACAVVAWAVLTSRRQRRAYEESLTAWAAERAAQEERLRIARELHDLASHGLGLITIRAAAASGVAGVAGDEERRRALAEIEDAGRAATAELRRMLTVLRSTAEEAAPLHPLDGLEDLPAIVAGSFAPAVLDRGQVGEAPAGVQAAVCAIAREALANVARHAGPVPVRVTLRSEGGDVVLTVEDEGPAPGWHPHPGAGHGIAGMRERAAAFGGTLHAGPVHPRGARAAASGAHDRTGEAEERDTRSGFRVEARLPCGERA